MTFGELVAEAYRARVQLSATGFYKTPDIHWDRETGRGEPFYYFVYGTAASEVTVDTLTGEYRGRPGRHPAGHRAARSIPRSTSARSRAGSSRAMGWVTTEETVVGRGGPAVHPCAVDLQDPAGIGLSGRVQRPHRPLVRECPSDHRAGPRRWANRRCCCARRWWRRCRWRLRASTGTGAVRGSTFRSRRSGSCRRCTACGIRDRPHDRRPAAGCLGMAGLFAIRWFHVMAAVLWVGNLVLLHRARSRAQASARPARRGRRRGMAGATAADSTTCASTWSHPTTCPNT